ncbi:MAG: ABC transporter substrate-binding protein [Alphaproteobacteria bacterium]|jgi:peptide/nickel transport system substrate-binding protein|nr:ABC transporter substrate-binding protein [Alphaproteobacteria bacterium]MDP6831936.1 ABC transporter substrate-binding protein [Alphaproteobacteria bacterium]MDP6873825.1 ABC transporter substrate-binding protein [Alphaproteobacteria bacterium]
MQRRLFTIASAVSVVGLMLSAEAALAQKNGGILKAYHRGTPPSGSIHEEATNSTVAPYMGVFNNLIMYDQAIAVESLDTIVPDLATKWNWNDDNTKLTFTLRKGVKFHDGKPFTAKDVVCTWNLVTGKSKAKLRKNPRKSWYKNLDKVTADNDYQATFHLKRKQPAFVALLASGYSPVYPCHVAPKKMRTHPIGTGPFKFVSLKQNEHVKFRKNENYWKKGKPHLDGIDWTIIKSRSTRVLAFIAGKFDFTFNVDVTIPLLKDVKAQAPHAVCDLVTTNVSTNLIVNQAKPPFDNAKVRKAMVLSIDRQAFIDILGHGQFLQGGAMMPPPAGVWGMAPEFLKTVAGYNPDIAGNRAKARKIMESLGYGPNKRLKVKVSTRNIAVYRDPAVILIDHMKEVYIDATLDTVETSNWHAKVARKDYMVGLNLTGIGVDDPDANFYENYSCGSQRNYTGYCKPEMEALFKQQSMMEDQAARKKLVWEIDKKLQEDAARPIISHGKAAQCKQPYVKGFVTHVNSLYNNWRMEDVWMDK